MKFQKRKPQKRKLFNPSMSESETILWTAITLDLLVDKVDNHLKHHQTYNAILVTALLMTVSALVVLAVKWVLFRGVT